MPSDRIDRAAFFKNYNIPEDAFAKTGLKWSELEDIYEDHIRNTPNLQPTANYIADRLRQIDAVHSLKLRVKHPEHLVEKIIRKKLNDNSLEYTLGNYKERITDLIGIRALHLFKGDWSRIHDFILDNWRLKERPTANVREGDPKEVLQLFKDKGCKIKEHEFGYRSVHYLIKSQPSKNLFVAEVQVRTIFEEGWSEIDHQIRYPYNLDNPITGQFLEVFNRLAGSADEMGSFIQVLKKYLKERDDESKNVQREYDKKVAELKSAIQRLEITEQQKKDLEKQLKEISSPLVVNPFAMQMPDFSSVIAAASQIKFPEFKLSELATLKFPTITAADLAKNSITNNLSKATPKKKEQTASSGKDEGNTPNKKSNKKNDK